jgi:flagellar biosynthesis protein FlhA
MPGKQMAIDADLTAGLIDEDEARARRERISEEADFYGAMDGATKFVKGDAIASILIVLINLIGGLAIGIGSLGLSFGEAANTYSLLTVGDGLVSQIPALFISIATGLLVTRVGTDTDMGSAIAGQLTGNARAMRISGMFVMAMALLPGLPKLPFLAVGGILLATSNRDALLPKVEDPPEAPIVDMDPDEPEALVGSMRVEPLELHLAYDILDLIDSAQGGDLLDRIRALRREMARELGIVMPYVRTRDDVSLPMSSYAVRLRGAEVGSGTAPKGRVMALPSGDGSELAGFGGTEAVEPVFGLKAYWLPDSARNDAAASGATVVDRSSVIVTHMAEVVRANAAALITRQDVQLLVEGLRLDEPILANEVGTETLSLGALHAVLRKLLEDRVSVRDLGSIVEAVSTAVTENRSIEYLANAARVALGRQILSGIAPQNKLAVLTLDPGLEAEMHESLREVDGSLHLALDPGRLDLLRGDLERSFVEAARHEHPAAIVCGQLLRRPLHRMLRGFGFEIPVLGYPELPSNVNLAPIGVIGLAHSNT